MPIVIYIHGGGWRIWADSWIPAGPERMDLARRVSPLTYVRKGLPPILTIHGDKDPTVPYEHGVRLDHALREIGAASELVTVPGGGHGNFSREQQGMVWERIFAFLEKHKLALSPSLLPTQSAPRAGARRRR